MPSEQFYSDLNAWMEANGISAEQLAKNCMEEPYYFQTRLEQKSLPEDIREVLDYLMNRKEFNSNDVLSRIVLSDRKRLIELARAQNLSLEELLSKYVAMYIREQ